MISFCHRLEGIKLVSFDVFDTVIARRCGEPSNVFRIVGEKLRAMDIAGAGPVMFQAARANAERRARRHKKGREITLVEIYDELNAFWRLPQDTVERMMACELESERETLLAIPGSHAMVNAAREAGKRVAFTSDMYLPEDFLRATLAGLGLIEREDPLYVSSRWGVSKADGGLYRVLLDREKLSPSEVLHIGDSRRVDYDKAHALGIQAFHQDRGTLNRYELVLAAAEESGSDGPTRLAGISRLARLEADPSGEQTVAARLGASIAGPLLTQYAEWVLRASLARGIKSLFFLARDGEAIMRLCQILAPAVGAADLELRYLYGSRQTWYPAALVGLDEPAAEFFARVAYSDASWEKCVEYLGLTASHPAIASLSARWSNWTPTAEAKQRLFLDIVADPICRPLVQTWLADKTRMASRYLQETGLVDTEPCGLVDCGWSGAWTDILSGLVTAQSGVVPEVYFLGRREAKTPSRSPTVAFLFDHQAGSGLDKIPDCFHIVVEFCLTASHGRTTGFCEKAGRVEPVLEATDLQGFTSAQWTTYRAALFRFAELYSLTASHEQPLLPSVSSEAPKGRQYTRPGQRSTQGKGALARRSLGEGGTAALGNAQPFSTPPPIRLGEGKGWGTQRHSAEQTTVPTPARSIHDPNGPENRCEPPPGTLLPDMRQAMVDVVSLLGEHPSTGDAALLGAHVVGLSPSTPGTRQLARAYTCRDLLRLVFRFSLPGYPPIWWHEGSQAMTPIGLRIPIGILWQFREFARAATRERGSGFGLRRLIDLGLRSVLKVRRECRPPAECQPFLVENAGVCRGARPSPPAANPEAPAAVRRTALQPD